MDESEAILEHIDSVEYDEIVIAASDLTLAARKGYVYQGIDLDIPRGKTTAICGESGSGKTSLLLTLTGRMVAGEGSLVVSGREMPRERNEIFRIAGLGFFDHVNDVQSSQTVATLVSSELELCGRPSSRARAKDYLRRFGFLDYADKRVIDLDAEQRIRFGIILGLAGTPDILAVDDIETALTHHQSRKLMRYLCDVSAEEGLTVLVGCVEYEIARGADCVALLSEAAVERRSEVEDIIASRRVGIAAGNKDVPLVVGGCAAAKESASDEEPEAYIALDGDDA